ncbi:hypothetical protein CT0861_09488, partial [Colletotrichum tofieldiae]
LQDTSTSAISHTQEETSPASSIVSSTFTIPFPSQRPTLPGSQVLGETLSVTGEPGTTGSHSATSDETSSQIAGIENTAKPVNSTAQITVVVTTSEPTSTQSSGISTSVGALTSFDASTSRDPTRTAVSTSLSATSWSIRSIVSNSNVSISASSSGNFPTSAPGSVEGNTNIVTWTLTAKGGFEPDVACIST